MNTTTDLGTTPMKRLVLQLALPSMAAQFVNVLYSIIDRMYIGHISGDGALALAGAGVCGPVVTLLTSFGTLVGIEVPSPWESALVKKAKRKPARFWRTLFSCYASSPCFSL